ncbi:MAG TPA: hypothetical protein VF981_03505 [Gemmatimonadaceae bacterium]
MDENLTKIIVVGIIGFTIMVSMVAQAVVRMVRERRRRELPDDATASMERRLQRIEEAIDAMAGEVERVSEGQRLTSRLLSERETHST